MTEQKTNFDALVSQIEQTNEALQNNARLVINRHVTAKAWLTGYYIVEYEQNGSDRAKYGEKLLQNLAKRLGNKYAISTLKLHRQFYLTYPQLSNNIGTFLLKLPIGQSLISQLQLPDNQEDTIGQSLIAQSNTIRRTQNVQFVGVAPDKHLFQSTNLISLQRNAWQSSCVRRIKD